MQVENDFNYVPPAPPAGNQPNNQEATIEAAQENAEPIFDSNSDNQTQTDPNNPQDQKDMDDVQKAIEAQKANMQAYTDIILSDQYQDYYSHDSEYSQDATDADVYSRQKEMLNGNKEGLDKFNKSTGQEYSSVDDIPKDELNSFFEDENNKDFIDSLGYQHDYNLQQGHYDPNADGNIAQGKTFLAQNGEHIGVNENGACIKMDGVAKGEDGSDLSKEEAKVAIQDRIAEAYGLDNDTDGDGHISLDSEIGSFIADTIAHENPEIFDGYDFAEGTVDKFTERIYDYMQEHPDFELNVAGVSANSIYTNEGEDILTQEHREKQFSELHTKVDSVKAEEGASNILGSLEYAGSTLKDEWQDAVVANSFNDNILQNPELQGLSYEDTLAKAQELAENDPSYAKVVEDLKKLGDSDLANAGDLAAAIAQKRDSINANGQNIETPEQLQSLALASVEQEVLNNFNPDDTEKIMSILKENPGMLFTSSIADICHEAGVDAPSEFRMRDTNYARNVVKPAPYTVPKSTGGSGGPGPEPGPGPGPEPCDEPPEQIPPDNCDEAPEQT